MDDVSTASPVQVDPTTTPETDDITLLATPWVTIVWNDPVNLMSYVTYVFTKYFGYDKKKAERLMLEVHHDGKSAVSDGSREERRGEKSEPGDRSPTWGWRPTIREQERDEDADDSGDRCEGHVCEQRDRHCRRPAAATSPSAPRRIGDAGHGPDERDSAPPEQPAHQIAG